MVRSLFFMGLQTMKILQIHVSEKFIICINAILQEFFELCGVSLYLYFVISGAADKKFMTTQTSSFFVHTSKRNGILCFFLFSMSFNES